MRFVGLASLKQKSGGNDFIPAPRYPKERSIQGTVLKGGMQNFENALFKLQESMYFYENANL